MFVHFRINVSTHFNLLKINSIIKKILCFSQLSIQFSQCLFNI